jgi:hypothetical protein
MTSAFDVLNLLGITIVSVALGYTAFWAFNVRKALAIRVYRHQALGIALIASTYALSLIVNTVSAYVVYGDPLFAVGQGGYGLFFVFLVMLFYWIDSSVIASRRSDPLGREILRWSKLRIALWIGTLPAALIVIPVDLYVLIFQGGNFGGSAPGSLGIVLILGIFIPPISGAVLLPIMLRRTVDSTLRRQLKWFGLFAAVFLVVNLFLGNQPDRVLGLFYTYLGSLIGAFCLYRSVLSLTPVKSVSAGTGQIAIPQ